MWISGQHQGLKDCERGETPDQSMEFEGSCSIWQLEHGCFSAFHLWDTSFLYHLCKHFTCGLIEPFLAFQPRHVFGKAMGNNNKKFTSVTTAGRSFILTSCNQGFNVCFFTCFKLDEKKIINLLEAWARGSLCVKFFLKLFEFLFYTWNCSYFYLRYLLCLIL